MQETYRVIPRVIQLGMICSEMLERVEPRLRELAPAGRIQAT